MTEPESVGPRRDPLDVLLEEYLAQHRRGDAESIREFVERSAKANPHDAARIRELLPQLAQVQVLLESVVAETPTVAPLLEPGARIRHYRIERHIGSGGMGEVYLARNTMLDSFVAMKLLSAKFSDDPQLSAAFEREARMAAHLDHPNIATVHDFFRMDGQHYLVMEFVEGQSLGHLLKEVKRLPPARLLDLGVQIAQALAAAHRRGIIHRDLKPDNAMITRDGRVKILDFGLAKVDQASGPASSRFGTSVFDSGTVLGTAGYMSPEQVRAQPVDARSDIFALGVVLYEMATGTSPFRRPTFADTQSAILKEQPKSATTLNPDVPLELARLIDKLLAKDPGDRYQSADAVLEDLNALRSPRTAKEQTLPTKILRIVAPLTLLALLTLWLARPGDDPRIAELTDSLSPDIVTLNGLVDAKGRLGDLERDLGANKPELAAPRELLKTKTRAALDKWLENLAAELAAGATDVDAASFEDIKRLDDDGTVCERAKTLVEGARDLRARVSGTRDEVEQLLEDSTRLDDAWDRIKTHLHPRVDFEGRSFEFATKVRTELTERLLALLVDLLNESDDSRIEDFEEHLDLLKRVDQTHPDIKRFETRADELRNRKKLQQLHEDALEIGESNAWWEVTDHEARKIVEKLEKLDWQAENIDPQGQSDEHMKVQQLLEHWEATGRFCDAFVQGQPLDDASIAADEAAGVASAWLRTYRKALQDAAQDPASARAALRDLDPTKLALRFQSAATSLRRQLEVGIAASADANTERMVKQAQRLVGAIRERSRKLQLPTETQDHDLTVLRSRPELAGLDSLFEPVKEALDEVGRQQTEACNREGDYARLRTELRSSDSLSGLDERFTRLMEGWRREKRSLDAAIEYSPEGTFDALETVNQDLLWRRAAINLRLRRYSDALDDVRASKRAGTIEGLLLAGMAKFGLGALDEASEDFGKAAQANAGTAQARALYWLGTIANAKEQSTSALTHLGRAIELGDGPADAYHQAAVLYVARGKAAGAENGSGRKPWFTRAIASASKSLDSRSEYTEDEMVALFAGVPVSEYSARAKEFRYTALLVRADAHFNLGDYEACIKDCTDVVSIRPTLAEAYYWRGCARYESGDKGEAVQDLDRAIDRAADGSSVKTLAQDLRKQILEDK